MNTVELIQAAEGDTDQVLEFYRDAIANTADMERYGRWIYGLHPTDAMIEGYIRSGAMYLFMDKGELLCALALTPSQGSDYHDTPWTLELGDEEVAVVHLLCVNPRYQKQGIGRRAMREILELSRRMGKQAVRLDALACNTPAHRLYESLGFQRRGTAHWYADNVGWTVFYLYELLL